MKNYLYILTSLFSYYWSASLVNAQNDTQETIQLFKTYLRLYESGKTDSLEAVRRFEELEKRYPGQLLYKGAGFYSPTKCISGNCENGRGVLLISNHQFVCNFNNGKPVGLGLIVYASGAVLEGMFNGFSMSKGTLYLKKFAINNPYVEWDRSTFRPKGSSVTLNQPRIIEGDIAFYTADPSEKISDLLFRTNQIRLFIKTKEKNKSDFVYSYTGGELIDDELVTPTYEWGIKKAYEQLFNRRYRDASEFEFVLPVSKRMQQALDENEFHFQMYKKATPSQKRALMATLSAKRIVKKDSIVIFGERTVRGYAYSWGIKASFVDATGETKLAQLTDQGASDWVRTHRSNYGLVDALLIPWRDRLSATSTNMKYNVKFTQLEAGRTDKTVVFTKREDVLIPTDREGGFRAEYKETSRTVEFTNTINHRLMECYCDNELVAKISIATAEGQNPFGDHLDYANNVGIETGKWFIFNEELLNRVCRKRSSEELAALKKISSERYEEGLMEFKQGIQAADVGRQLRSIRLLNEAISYYGGNPDYYLTRAKVFELTLQPIRAKTDRKMAEKLKTEISSLKQLGNNGRKMTPSTLSGIIRRNAFKDNQRIGTGF